MNYRDSVLIFVASCLRLVTYGMKIGCVTPVCAGVAWPCTTYIVLGACMLTVMVLDILA